MKEQEKRNKETRKEKKGEEEQNKVHVNYNSMVNAVIDDLKSRILFNSSHCKEGVTLRSPIITCRQKWLKEH